ncbi:MAG: sigma-70 family RNA polymerase sigma factor [Chloroflexota bacterium]
MINWAGLSDEQLIERIVDHDRDAFGLLYERYAQSVYTLAVYIVGQREAEGAAQEVFVHLWRKAEQFERQRGSFRSWFMALARNRLRDARRRLHQHEALLPPEEVEQLLTAVDQANMRNHANNDVLETTWHSQRRGAILQALQQLPAAQRQVILLAYFGGHTQAAIATQLGWPLGTVKKRLRLGLQKLRSSLLNRDQVLDLAHPIHVDKES